MFPLKNDSILQRKRRAGTDSHTSLHIIHTERHNLTGLTFFGHRKNNVILSWEMPELLSIYHFKANMLSFL